MAAFSKNRYRLAEHLPCSVLHPWTTSCTYNCFVVFLKSVKGGSNFFLLLYLVQLLPKKSSYKWGVLKEQAINLLRTSLFTGVSGGFGIGAMCFIRRLTGKHSGASLGIIAGMLSGVGIFVESPSKRTTYLTLLIALVADLYVRLFQDEDLFVLSLPVQLLIFIACSCPLLYYLRSEKDTYSLLWPFSPKKLSENPENRRHYPHKGTCLENVTKTGSMYFCYGFVLQMVKVTLFNFTMLFSKPSSFLRAFMKWENLRLPLFTGLYFSVFKGISCLLCQYRGQDEAWHTLPAGTIASLCYLIQPNFYLALFAFSNLTQIICRQYKKKIGLPNWPWQEYVFMVCMGLLFYARAVYPQCFPNYMITVMDTVTDGRAPVVYQLVEQNVLYRF